MNLRLQRWTSSLSPLLIVTDDDGHLRALEFADPATPQMKIRDNSCAQPPGAGSLQQPRIQAQGPIPSRLARLLREHYGPHYALRDGAAPTSITGALDAYFRGDVTAIDACPTATAGTAFQREVWQALREIPAGATLSYGRLAARLGRPGSARAVGAANGANPIPIVVPCHRVIGADGTLTGFASGLPRKRWLLDHERQFAHTTLFKPQLAS